MLELLAKYFESVPSSRTSLGELKRKARLSPTLLFALLPAWTPAGSQTVGPLIAVDGTCSGKSAVTINDGQPSHFGCDSAVITRSVRGTVLIQFTDKTGDDGRILGFAGTIEGKQGFGADTLQAIEVERLYLAGGAQPLRVSKGTCFMNWTGLQRRGGKLTAVVCGARAQAQGADVKAIAALSVLRQR